VDFGKRGYKVEYFNVKKDAEAMRRYLELSGGERRVPLIREEATITVGFGGT
jgi:hypothetical protein